MCKQKNLGIINKEKFFRVLAKLFSFYQHI